MLIQVGMLWYNVAWNGVKKGAKAAWGGIKKGARTVASFGSGAVDGVSEAVSYGIVTKDATIENPNSFQLGKIVGNFGAAIAIAGVLITGFGAGTTVIGGGVSGGALVPVGIGVTTWGVSIVGSGMMAAAGNIRDFFQASDDGELGSGSGGGGEETKQFPQRTLGQIKRLWMITLGDMVKK